jgi:hypothetical protein
MHTLTTDQVRTVISDEKATKKQLQDLAVKRFCVPNGSLNMSIDNLRKKLVSMADNEDSHTTIVNSIIK